MSWPSNTVSAARQNLRRLVAIRYVALAGQVAALLFFTLAYPLELPVVTLALLIAVFAGITLATHWRIHHLGPVSATEFCGHLLLDMLSLSALLYFSGGATNPFVSYFLVPIIIGGVILPRRLMWVVTLVAISAYSLLFFYHQPLMSIAPHAATGTNLHLLGMWFNFFISAMLIAYFVVRMAETLRAQEQRLNAQRQEQMETEQLLAIATVAAGAAHELGTPLNTIRLLAEELLDQQAANAATTDSADSPPLLESSAELLKSITEQIDICRDILRKLTGLTSDTKKPVLPVEVSEYINDLLDYWQLLRPEIQHTINITPPGMPVQGKFHPVVRQALINLFNNAADASPDRVTITINWDPQQLQIVIRDYGSGLTSDQLESIGRPMTSSKPAGLGLGLYLTSGSLQHHGGQVLLTNAEGGGLITQVLLNLGDSTP